MSKTVQVKSISIAFSDVSVVFSRYDLWPGIESQIRISWSRIFFSSSRKSPPLFLLAPLISSKNWMILFVWSWHSATTLENALQISVLRILTSCQNSGTGRFKTAVFTLGTEPQRQTWDMWSGHVAKQSSQLSIGIGKKVKKKKKGKDIKKYPQGMSGCCRSTKWRDWNEKECEKEAYKKKKNEKWGFEWV